MDVNPLGIIAALSAFLGIWLGHVAVRKIEFISATIWIPSLAFVVLGLFLEFCSVIADNISLKIALGIIGITLLWDAAEFTRQQRRIYKGHAPANPDNPRHARILADPNTHATTIDLLKREPTGKIYPID